MFGPRRLHRRCALKQRWHGHNIGSAIGNSLLARFDFKKKRYDSGVELTTTSQGDTL